MYGLNNWILEVQRQMQQCNDFVEQAYRQMRQCDDLLDGIVEAERRMQQHTEFINALVENLKSTVTMPELPHVPIPEINLPVWSELSFEPRWSEPRWSEPRWSELSFEPRTEVHKKPVVVEGFVRRKKSDSDASKN